MKQTTFVLLYLFVAMTLRAEVTGTASLEWLADKSVNVGIYQVAQTRRESASTFSLSFRLAETLKGTPSQSRTSKDSEPPNVDIGDRFLIFFLKFDDDEEAAAYHVINLSSPPSEGLKSLAINCKFEVLTEGAAILATVRGRLRSHPAAALTSRREYITSLSVEVPYGSPAHKILYRGSSCFLRVPEDLIPAKTTQ